MPPFLLVFVLATAMALPASERCGFIRADIKAALSAGQEGLSAGREGRFLGMGWMRRTCDTNGDGVIQDTELVGCYDRFLFNPFTIQLLLPFFWAGCGTTTTTTTTDTDGDGDGDVDGDGVRMIRRTLHSFSAPVRKI